MQVIIAGDNEPTAHRIRELLTLHGLSCPAGHVVQLASAADRAGRFGPELMVLVLPTEPEAGLNTLREVRRVTQNVATLVVGPADDAQLILRALHEGANEYLNEDQVDEQLGAALIRLKAKQSSCPESEKSGKLISLLAPSGGCGSSMLAANISTILARKHGECGLIDMRLATGDLASMLNLKPTHTIADLCQNVARVDRSMFEQFFVRHSSGVHLLAGPADFADIESVSVNGIRRTLAMARSRFSCVVLDLDNAFSLEQVEALWQSDVILLVLRPDYTSLRNVRRAMANFTKLGLGSERVQVVLNKYGQRRQLSALQAEEALGIKPRHCIPDDPARVNRAINQGMPIVLQQPRAKISKSIEKLTMSVNGHNGETRYSPNPTNRATV